MDEKEFLEQLKQLSKRLPDVYRHLVGLIKALLAMRPAR